MVVSACPARREHSIGLGAVTFAVGLLLTGPASAFLARPIIFSSIGAATAAPKGWVQFCVDHPDDCRPNTEDLRDLELTPEGLQQLFSINGFVNSRVRYTTDRQLYRTEEHWDYPLDRGDCEDYVLLKRRLLIEAGWPRHALMITVVQDPHEPGDNAHAVLTVRSDRGELILDNQTPEILFWYETGYRFLKRQSPADPNAWVAVVDNRPGEATAQR